MQAVRLKRRDFMILVGRVAAAWPIAASAQQQGTLPIIGFLGPATPLVAGNLVDAFVRRLRELGWIEGRSITIEYRWAEGRNDRYAEIAAEFVEHKVDIIVTWGSAPTIAAKQATVVIPIVFAAQMDPLSAGLVASLARPGGNVTGLSLQQTDTTGKRLELLREIVPKLRRLAIMGNVDSPGAVLEMREVATMAHALGLEVSTLQIRKAEDIPRAVGTFKSRTDALYVATDPLLLANRMQTNALAQDARLPTIYGSREYVEAGGLMCYGPSFPDLFMRAAEYVDKILRGAKPAELPVEQPTKFNLVINVKTAKALGLAIPESLLLRADEVIE